MPMSGEYAASTAGSARERAGSPEASPADVPLVVLTTIGKKPGDHRTTPLMRVEHDGRYAVIGSLGGASKHPVWVHDIRANPRVALQDGDDEHDYLARETDGDERADWLKRAIAGWPAYADYLLRTTRVIPVFVLTREEFG
jgi:deazaflavin-dependent oxidoreductase (nitroreductase family)